MASMLILPYAFYMWIYQYSKGTLYLTYNIDPYFSNTLRNKIKISNPINRMIDPFQTLKNEACIVNINKFSED